MLVVFVARRRGESGRTGVRDDPVSHSPHKGSNRRKQRNNQGFRVSFFS